MRIPSSLVVCALSAFVIAPPALAADPATLLTGYNLTSWTLKDGIASARIWSLAQDSIGYLWVGTDAGVLRFDGVRFVPWDTLASIPNPGASVRSICVSRDATVWFGLGEPGGIVSLRSGVARTYGTNEGLPEGIVMAVVEGADGTIWAGGRFGVYRLSSDQWRRADDGLPPGIVNALSVDGDGLIAATSTGVFRRGGGEALFTRLAHDQENSRTTARDRSGRLWVTDPIVGFRRVAEGRAQAPTAQKGRGSRLMHDSRGNLWVGTGGQGLWRVQHTESGAVGVFERTSTATGLSDDGVTELIEDREGNIWVATRDGLNRLTPHKVTPITDVGIVTAVDVTRDGRLWVGTVDAVVSFAAGHLGSRSPPIPIRNPPIAAMHADSQGTLWVATARELLRIRNDRSESMPLNGAPMSELTGVTSDGTGGLWLHDATHGLWRWRAGTLTPGPLPKALQTLVLLATHTDRNGRAWFSFESNRVAVIESSGTVHVYDDTDGLSAGPYRAIHQDRSGAIWFGGNGGLTRFAAGAFTTLPAFPSRPGQSVTGIVDDAAGALWLAVEAAGILRLSREEIARALANRSHQIRYTAYDKVDGSAGTSRWFGNRAAVRASDGRLWFVTGRGLTVVDPDALGDERTFTDRVRIEAAVVDGRLLSGASPQVLPHGTARIQIDYTVLNLTSPQKTWFRHRLDGFDPDWLDAGTRHSAFYANLPPGSYTFRVMATGADGTFAGSEGEWQFTIRSAFYQTWLFAWACLAAAALAIGAVWRLNVLRIRKQFSLLLGERVRLSREMHDTLLQSMFGYALQFDALADEASSSAPYLRERLSRLRHQVEDDIREARQSIWNLRSPRLEHQDLPSTLRDVAGYAVASANIEFAFELTGTPRRASPQVEEQLLRIGREAISNVVRHAQASRVRVALAYEERGITLTVADDGRGFEQTAQPEMSEHFGLTTMRERTESVGGTLQVQSGEGKGTSVTAVVPGA